MQDGVGEFFGAVANWLAFATNPAAEPARANAIAQPAAREAISLLSSRQAETIRQHFGNPVQFLTLLDAYERFGDNSLPDDPLRPARPRHSMDAPANVVQLGGIRRCLPAAGLRAPNLAGPPARNLAGPVQRRSLPGPLHGNQVPSHAAGKQAMRDHVRNLDDAALQPELRARFAASGFA